MIKGENEGYTFMGLKLLKLPNNIKTINVDINLSVFINNHNLCKWSDILHFNQIISCKSLKFIIKVKIINDNDINKDSNIIFSVANPASISRTQ